MFCKKCGYKNEDSAKFCKKCGESLKKPNFMPKNMDNEIISKAPTKKQNKKPILIIVTAIVLIGLGVSGYFFIVHQQKVKADEAYAVLFSTAEQTEKAKNYDAAISAYQSAISQRPEDARLYLGLADTYIGKNDYDSAAKILQTGYSKTQSTQISSKLSEVHKKLEDIKAANAAKKKAEDEAKAKETEYNSQLSEADKALNEGDISHAQQLYQKAIVLKANDKQVYLDISSRFEKKPDLDDALKILIQGTKNVTAAEQQTLQKQIEIVRKEYKPVDLLGKQISEFKELFGSDFKNVSSIGGGYQLEYDDNRIPYVFGYEALADDDNNINNNVITSVEIVNIGDDIFSGAKLGMTYEQIRKEINSFKEPAPYIDRSGEGFGEYFISCEYRGYTICLWFNDSNGSCIRAWVQNKSLM